MGTTANGLDYPELTDASNGPGGIQGLAVDVDARYGLTVAAFSDLAGISSPFTGMRVWVAADTAAYTYNGSAWVNTSGKQWAYTTSAVSTPLSSTTLSDVAGFTFDAVPGVYAFDLTLFLLNPASSGVDMKFGFTFTGTGEMAWGYLAPSPAINAPNYAGDTNFATVLDSTSPADTGVGIGTPAGISLRADIAGTYVCTVAGTVQLQFAQFVSDPTYAGQITYGSRMVAERIA